MTCTAKDSQGLDNIITEVITVQDTTAPKFVTPKTFTTAPDDKKTCAYRFESLFFCKSKTTHRLPNI